MLLFICLPQRQLAQIKNSMSSCLKVFSTQLLAHCENNPWASWRSLLRWIPLIPFKVDQRKDLFDLAQKECLWAECPCACSACSQMGKSGTKLCLQNSSCPPPHLALTWRFLIFVAELICSFTPWFSWEWEMEAKRVFQGCRGPWHNYPPSSASAWT